MTIFDMPRRCLPLLVLLTSAPGFAQQPREFGAASFVPPSGWTVDARPTFQTYGRVRDRNLCMVAVYADEPSPRALDQAFAGAWDNIFGHNNYRRADRPASTLQVSPGGYRHAVGEGDLEDRGGNRFIARLHVFPVGAKTQSIVLLANSRAALDECQPEWASFFASLRFPSVAAESRPVAGNRPDPTPPAVAPSESPRPARPNEPASRSPQQFDNITFIPPAGWSVRRTTGFVELTPTDARSEEVLRVLLLPGRPFSGTLATEFQAAWSEVLSLLGAQGMLTVNRVAYDLDQPARSLRGTEFLRGDGGMRRADGAYGVTVYVFHVGDRVERVAVVGRDFRANVTMMNPASNSAYDAAIRELVFTLQFANQPERPLAPAGLRAGGIVGVWTGIAMSMGKIKSQFAIFFDNGVAYFGSNFPARGLLAIDPVVEQPAQQRYWGTYTMSGDAGVLTMPYGTIPLRRSGTALELTTTGTLHKFVRLSMPDAPLDGTWCFEDGHCLRLTPDGRFQDNGAVRIMEHSTYEFPATPASGAGRYTLRDYTMILSYDGGPEIRMAFVGLPSDRRAPTPAELRLSFNADMLVLRR